MYVEIEIEIFGRKYGIFGDYTPAKGRITSISTSPPDPPEFEAEVIWEVDTNLNLTNSDMNQFVEDQWDSIIEAADKVYQDYLESLYE